MDIAHIFGSGYDPFYYIQRWLRKYPNTIKLVHFNDSMEKRGSRLDRHYTPGLGCVGFQRMTEVHELCIKENIPMIVEY